MALFGVPEGGNLNSAKVEIKTGRTILAEMKKAYLLNGKPSLEMK